MSTADSPFENGPKKRPVFLLVLCILTFCYSGFSLFSSIYSYFTAAQTAVEMEKAKAAMNASGDAGSKKFAKVFDSMTSFMTEGNMRHMAIGAILTSLLCLAGAFLMFRLNKKGFILYIAGTIVGIAVPFLVMGSNIMGMVSTVFAGVIGLAFCIMYGVNLKEMK